MRSRSRWKKSISTRKSIFIFAECVAEVFEREARIAPGVAHDDVAAAPPHHLVEREIFEMAPVGKIDIRAVVRR